MCVATLAKGTDMEVRGQSLGVSCLLPHVGRRDQTQASWQMPLHEPSPACHLLASMGTRHKLFTK